MIGNLICKSVAVEFSDQLDQNDFPISMKVTYTLEHGMPRDRDAIESMFNRGNGRIYVLPDWAKTSGDYMTKVDKWVGNKDDGMVRAGIDPNHPAYGTDGITLSAVRNKDLGQQYGNVRPDTKMQTSSVVNGDDYNGVLNVPKYRPLDKGEALDFNAPTLKSRGSYIIDLDDMTEATVKS